MRFEKKAIPRQTSDPGPDRYGGLQTPSETLSLRWEDIDWEMNRMSIPEPKVEHHEGRGIGSCPIFPELRSILDEAFEIFGDKSEYVVAAPQYRAAANTAMGWKNSNLMGSIPSSMASRQNGLLIIQQNPIFLATRATRKTTRIWGARREIQRRTTPCTEPAWVLQKAKAIGKIWEKANIRPQSGEWKVEPSCGQDRNRTF